MRLASCLFAALLIAPISIPSAPVAAQQPFKLAPCEGKYNFVRVSEIKPGMMPKFLEAVAAQKAWYKKQGKSDEISVMRVIDTKTGTYSETEAVTTHVSNPEDGHRPPRDAAYDAFVALFRASSDIKSEYFTCSAR